MPELKFLYTYHGGRKLPLNKRPDRFVVRTLPERLHAAGFTNFAGAGQASTPFETRPGELEATKERSRRGISQPWVSPPRESKTLRPRMPAS